MPPLLSIVIPVFNAEKTVSILLDSLAAQTVADFEAILIDDGSIDGSGRICDEYCSKDNRFSVFHIDNHGVSYARNLGIKKSRADLITFIDSDDSVKPDYCKAILREMVDNDLLVFQTEMCSSLGNRILVQESGQFDGRVEVEEGLSSLHSRQFDHFGWPWNKVYRRHIIVDNGIIFPIGVNWYEDEVFALRYAVYVDKMKIVPDIIHCYNVHDGGLTYTALSAEGVSTVADLIRDEINWICNDRLRQGFVLQIFRFYNRSAVLEKSILDKSRRFNKARSYYHQNKECIQLEGKFDRLIYSLPYVAGLVCFLLFGREL